jgi:pSer/pThr/pTyr-binding forkhead associated (FHA) protein
MQPLITVTYMSGPLDGKVLSFTQPALGEETIIHIGRREGTEIHLPFDNQASRLHARLGLVSTAVSATESVVDPFLLSFWLEDMNSRNGTFLERDKQHVRGRISLRPGTLFRVGRTWLRLDVPLNY